LFDISVLVDVYANLPETSPFFVCPNGFGEHLFSNVYTLQSRTGPEQGFFSSPGNPVMKTGFSLCGKTTQGKPCFHYRDGFAV
jgi:hypothetical protein